MPLTYPGNPMIPSAERVLVPQPGVNYIDKSWIGRYNYSDCQEAYPAEPSARQLFLYPGVTNVPNAEIIIRNYGFSTSWDGQGTPIFPNAPRRSIAVLAIDGASIEYNSNLGSYIPPGGIMELKRIGNSDTWSAYGYIFPFPEND